MNNKVVYRQAGKDFRILQLTDTQIIDPGQMAFPSRLGAAQAERWKDRDANCFNYVRRLIEGNKPDLIVLTGDNVYGSFDADGSNFKALVDLVDGYGIPWTQVFGNHDGETYDLEDPRGAAYPWGKGYGWQMDYLMHGTKYCLFEPGPDGIDNSRHGNFVIEVKENDKTVYALILLDSHDGVTEPMGITDGQINWYVSQAGGKYGNVPNMIFQHIPLYHHYLASLKYTDNGNGIISEGNTVLPNGDWGELKDKTTYATDMYIPFSMNMWNAIQKCGNTKAVCVGHYHTNAMRIKYKGDTDKHAVQLVFGVKTSTFDYGYRLGGTLITLKSGNDEPEILPLYLD